MENQQFQLKQVIWSTLRTMYNSDTGNMNTVLETMVKRGTLTDEQITEIKEQRKS